MDIFISKLGKKGHYKTIPKKKILISVIDKFLNKQLFKIQRSSSKDNKNNNNKWVSCLQQAIMVL